jgi:hypothetical protein
MEADIVGTDRSSDFFPAYWPLIMGQPRCPSSLTILRPFGPERGISCTSTRRRDVDGQRQPALMAQAQVDQRLTAVRAISPTVENRSRGLDARIHAL